MKRSSPAKAKKLSHFDAQGQAHMVDVGGKTETRRIASACGRIRMQAATLRLIQEGTAKKGDVLGVARIAAIQAAKRTAELIPLAHPLALTRVAAEFAIDTADCGVALTVTVETLGRTGVEMESMTGASLAALTIYDMCKGSDKSITIGEIRLLFKEGGKSGVYKRAMA